MFYTYVYRDPSRKNEPIYCGKGQGRRAYDHLNDAQNNHLRNRLAKMKRNGIEPIINVVNMTSEALAIQCEIDTIARFGRKDFGKGPLLNQTDGGEGTSGWIPSESTRKRIGDGNRGKSPSVEARKKMSDAQRGKTLSTSHIRKLKLANISKPKSVETRKKLSDFRTGTSQTAETRKKISNASTGDKNGFYGKKHTTESIIKMSKPRPIVVCPHCGKEGGDAIMRRWHFDKCKSRNKDDK